jgi:thioredoxin reductase (NADPH)
VTGRTVLIAIGCRYRKLNLPRQESFEGAGVYYAATEAEAGMCHGDAVVVVGGSNSAGQAAVFLAQRASRVRLLLQHGDLRRDMSRYLVDQIERTSGIEVLLHTEVRELVGDEARLEAVITEDNQSGQPPPARARALFVFIGADPHSGWIAGQLALDDSGFVLTGSRAARSASSAAPQSGRRPRVVAAPN